MKELFLLFDLDGTLWDSANEVAESWNIIMREYDPALPALTSKDIRSVMGRTMDEISGIVLQSMPADQRKSLFERCSSFEVEYISEHGGKMFPGVKRTIARLFDAGYKMALISNCQRGYIDAFLNSMNMNEYFCDREEWGNTLLSKADNIRLVMERNGFKRAVYIGDTEHDRLAAKNAGIPFIHASYGFGDISGSAVSISEFPELYTFLENPDSRTKR